MSSRIRILCPCLEKICTMKGCSCRVRVVGKIPDQHLNASLSANPGDNVLILVESKGQMCPIVFHLFWTLSPRFENNDTLLCWSLIFLTTLIYMVLLENCWINLSMHGWSPIQRTCFFLFFFYC